MLSTVYKLTYHSTFSAQYFFTICLCSFPVTCVQNLGVYLDEELTMKQPVTHSVKVSYLAFRKIRVIRPYLTEEATHMLFRTLILSQIDYCKSLLIGISIELLNKLN